jgi:hypothetical protein
MPPGQPPATSADWVDSFDYSTLPTPLGIDHFEHRLEEPGFRDQMLRFLEELIYRRHQNVWIASVKDPLGELEERARAETDATGPAAAELDRWTRLFSSFRTEHIRLEDAGLKIGDRAVFYYRAVWHSCSRSERLALRQLAEEGVVNPRNRPVLASLMRDGLILRQPTFRIINETFRQFIVEAVSPDTVAAWEREGVPVSWGIIKATLLTVALGLGAMLVLTQEQLLDAWIGYVPTFAAAVSTAVPAVIRLFGSFQGGTPADTGTT